MEVSLSNVQSHQRDSGRPHDTADIIISYGTAVETYRQVQIGKPYTLRGSGLVTVKVTGPQRRSPRQESSRSITAPGRSRHSRPSASSTRWTSCRVPGIPSLDRCLFSTCPRRRGSPHLVTSVAVAYCERKRAFYIVDTKFAVPAPAGTSTASSPISARCRRSRRSASTPRSTPRGCKRRPGHGENDRPGDGETDRAATQRVRSRMYPRRTAPRSMAVPGQHPGLAAGHDGRRYERGDDRFPAGGPEPHRNRLLTAVPLSSPRHWGTRTTAASTLPTGMDVRRRAADGAVIEQNLCASLTWAVFQGNSRPLWTTLTQEVTAFMLSLFRRNTFAGTKPSDSFLVQCDATTTHRRTRPTGWSTSWSASPRSKPPSSSSSRWGSSQARHRARSPSWAPFPGRPESL